MALNDAFVESMDKISDRFNKLKTFPNLLDRVNSSTNNQLYSDNVEKAKQLLDEFLGSLYNVYENFKNQLADELSDPERQQFLKEEKDDIRHAFIKRGD